MSDSREIVFLFYCILYWFNCCAAVKLTFALLCLRSNASIYEPFTLIFAISIFKLWICLFKSYANLEVVSLSSFPPNTSNTCYFAIYFIWLFVGGSYLGNLSIIASNLLVRNFCYFYNALIFTSYYDIY